MFTSKNASDFKSKKPLNYFYSCGFTVKNFPYIMIKMSEPPTFPIRKFKCKEMDLNTKVVITCKPGPSKFCLLKDLIYRSRRNTNKFAKCANEIISEVPPLIAEDQENLRE
jgi:hypothetical protein